jgi:hypothetical protein
MQTFVVETIVFFVKRLCDAKIYDEIEKLVGIAVSWDIPGPEKRERVLLELGNIADSLKPAVIATASWVLNLALEVAVARIKAGSLK